MAVYYVSPYVTTSGTGTSWASPLSVANSTRPTLVAGDQIRVVAQPLTTLLVSTVYTATYTDYRTLTITAGGGLGADFVAGTVVYLPGVDAFFRVNFVSANSITVNTTSCLPWYNTSSGQTSITVRRVDTAYLPQTLATQYLWNAGMRADVTVTDGWISDTVRDTSGASKSIFTTSSSSNATYYIDGTSSTIVQRNGLNIDLQNSQFIGHTSGGINVVLSSGGATYTINQIFSNTTTVDLTLGTSVDRAFGGSVTIPHYNAYYPFQGVFANGTTFTFTNLSMRYGDTIFYKQTDPVAINNCTINIGNVVGGGFGISSNAWQGASLTGQSNTINFNGVIDQFQNSAPIAMLAFYGNNTVTFGASFALYYNRRVTRQTTLQNKFNNNGTLTLTTTQLPSALTVPTIPDPPGVTFSAGAVNLTSANQITIGGNADGQMFKQPNVFRFDCPTMPTTALRPAGYTRMINILVTARDGTAPVEILGIYSGPYQITAAAANFPNVENDTSVFRTASPSLRSTLTTRAVAYWTSYARSYKNIKIPVTQGQTYTVSGYIRTNQAAYALGDCRMSIVFNNAEVVGQNMTTACINAWEQFSLNFTASQTGEAVLVWEMYYSAGASSYWLDDLVIS